MMSNVLVFLVMFCFSCSISFAGTEKFDAAKEKRYQEYKRQLEKSERRDSENFEFFKRSVKEKCGHPDWTWQKCDMQRAIGDMIPADKSAIVKPSKSEQIVDPEKAAKDKKINYAERARLMLNDSATRRAISREMLDKHKSLDEIIEERKITAR